MTCHTFARIASRIFGIAFTGLLFAATPSAIAGYGRITGREYGIWAEGGPSVIVARIKNVTAVHQDDQGKSGTHLVKFEPLATVAGHLDASEKETIDARVWQGRAGTGTSIQKIPPPGKLVLVVIEFNEMEQGAPRITCVSPDYCEFMPSGSALVEITGLDDPKIAETLKEIREARAHPDPDPVHGDLTPSTRPSQK